MPPGYSRARSRCYVYVDVTHEAIIREWPRLRVWLREDRDRLRVHRRLTEAVQEWAELQRDSNLVLRGRTAGADYRVGG